MPPHAETSKVGEACGPDSLAGEAGGAKPGFVVDSPDVVYTEDEILSKYVYNTTSVKMLPNGSWSASPKSIEYNFKVDRKVPKLGVMLVGWGGNNGSTITAAILANRQRLCWETKDGFQDANYFGSVLMSSTMKFGTDEETLQDVHAPLWEMLPFVHPDDLVIGGWDINSMNIADAMDRAKVLEPTLKAQIKKELGELVPLKSIYYPRFIAENQNDRADNTLQGDHACDHHLEQIRKDIRHFKDTNELDKVIVLWTANTERYADLQAGVNDTADNLLAAIKRGEREIAPSTVFAVACILEGVPFINGSPQNTFIPGCVELAVRHGVFIGGDDFKSGQTKMKSAMVDFIVNAGIKVRSIASYNHLGNNDGKNLSSHAQFRSKEISKSTVVDDMVASNTTLYPVREDAKTKQKLGQEKPDHIVVIKYVPAVGDSKRALDEYFCEIFMGGRQTISMTNICEDSLLAAPLIIDLVLLTEMMTRIQWKGVGDDEQYRNFHSVLSILSYMLKAPMVPPGTPVVNALAKQRAAMTNIFRAVLGLAPESDMTLEHKLM